ncbi:MAG: hypothetical protein KQ78_02130 [Candidatus Izimaplasma bacterium HR2]|nr:MAG: hypothetical protein KQ78_02130 [Candidatus Izimaplasma bacterium HR2]
MSYKAKSGLTNDGVMWDDIQVSLSNAKTPPSNAPTWRYYNHGVGSGIEYPVLGFAVNDYVFFDFQSYHAMKLDSILETHFHYTTPNDGDTKKFKFQLDVISAYVNGTWGAPTGSPFTTECLMDADFSGTHKLHETGTVPAVNSTVSTLYKCKLTRIAATDNEYASEVYVEFIDGHIQKDGNGSLTEYTK